MSGSPLSQAGHCAGGLRSRVTWVWRSRSGCIPPPSTAKRGTPERMPRSARLPGRSDVDRLEEPLPGVAADVDEVARVDERPPGVHIRPLGLGARRLCVE